MNPFIHITKGDVEIFKQIPLNDLRSARDENGDNVFTRSVMQNQLDCCREIYKRDPSLIWHHNIYGNTALHQTLLSGPSMEIVWFLLSAAASTRDEDDMESGRGENKQYKKWLAKQNQDGNTALIDTVNCRNLEIMKILVAEDNDMQLSRISNNKKNTPLHLAVQVQSLEMVKLLAFRDPDFNYCANIEGDTPLLIAIRKAHPPATSDDISVKIRKLLLERQPSQVKVPIMDNGWTVLHYATDKADLDAIKDIIYFCRDSINLVDKKGQIFLHVAAKCDHVDIVRYVLEISDIPVRVLNWKDNDGNTPLHITTSSGNARTALCLLYDYRVDKMTTNIKGEKVLDAISFDYDNERAGVHGVRERVDEKALKDQSDFDLVVCALIATVSFTAGITVPGGYISQGQDQGMAVLSKKASFQTFVISNTFALLFSLYAVFSHFCTRRLLRKKDIQFQVTVATSCTLSAIFAMMVAFISGSYAVLSISEGLAIAVCAICSSFFIFAFHSLLRMVMQYRR